MKRYILRLAGMVMMAFGLSFFMIYDLSSVSFLSPMEKAGDFIVSDFYQFVANGRNVHALEDRIVVVSIDGLSRNEITATLEAVNFCNPRAVGVDLFFNYPQPGDSLLLQALRKTPGLVLPCIIPADGNTDLPYLYNLFPDSFFGAVNLEISTTQGTVRNFRPFFHTRAEGTVPNFVSLLARHTSHTAYNQLCERLLPQETIYYPNTDFNILSADEVLQNAHLIEGKTVLIGTVADPQDMYRTSIRESMPGVLIHAHALATILQGTYIDRSPVWMGWLIAFALCTLIVALNSWLVHKEVGALIVRILQFMLLYAIAWTGCQLFTSYRIDIDFTRPLLMVSLGLVAVDVWIGTTSLIQMSKKLLKKFKYRFTHHTAQADDARNQPITDNPNNRPI
ncbi:MAG: CHASE2 domain-containing protein [Alistipes sp.]|nr:CHASE2 domain-containing protein [Alistipes senegalensis]MCM1251145.1 CHASE2 domain-containing protein [Alistipes sp.]